jgi:hypothetical protein
LGDTIGVGSAGSWRSLLQYLIKDAQHKPQQLAVHAHDTYGQALVNVLTALEVFGKVFLCLFCILDGHPHGGQQCWRSWWMSVCEGNLLLLLFLQI